LQAVSELLRLERLFLYLKKPRTHMKSKPKQGIKKGLDLGGPCKCTQIIMKLSSKFWVVTSTEQHFGIVASITKHEKKVRYAANLNTSSKTVALVLEYSNTEAN
jgi:hypothetical protein